ncbi:hypothetical protein JNB_03000 [Janibacter sp. HTCC2649]|nr:hypothetical protein [Janibacter sp. HTCC2649]EAP99102.1 hypothetical protein JNB_03000 [Janibacter sp. HTCC2649]
MAMIEWLTDEHFGSRVGERFDAMAGDGVAVVLELVEVVTSDEPGGRGPDGQERTQFSLLFRGPLSPALGQGTYDVRHAELEDFVLFLVPLGPDADGPRYEASFA